MIVCGTGHRPNKLGGYSKDIEDKLVAMAEAILFIIEPDKVISGMALGWDMALAKAVLLFSDASLIAAVPFIGQEKAWPEKVQKEYQIILESCSEVIVVSEGGYSPPKMQIRNQWMVDHSDLVIALWDGSKGGTGNCAAYANKQNKMIINFWDLWVAINKGKVNIPKLTNEFLQRK